MAERIASGEVRRQEQPVPGIGLEESRETARRAVSARGTIVEQRLAQPRVVALVRDLMFISKITAAARAAGREVVVVRRPVELPGTAGDRLIADLNLADAIAAAAQWKQATGGEVIGFVAHTDAAAIAQAQQAGLDQVMPRSRFVEVLPELFAE
jgi:DNA-binding NarL/FixJ family response regulator